MRRGTSIRSFGCGDDRTTEPTPVGRASAAPPGARVLPLAPMREVDTGEVEPLRYPIPDGLQKRAATLAKWMRIVGIFQACLAALAFVLMGIGAITAIIA